MADRIIRAISADGLIRAFVANTTELVEEARRRHDAWPTAIAALGRTMTAAGLFSATLKEEGESITLRVAGDGPLGSLIADADEQGNVRGYVQNPQIDLEPKDGKLNVSGAVGQGHIHLIRHLALEGTYTGTAEIISGEIAEDLTYYMAKSEQTPSAIALGVRVRPDGSVLAAGGYMIQLLPASNESDREQLEINLAALGSISQAVEQGLTPEQVLAQLMAGIEYKVTERREIRFSCRCSRERAIGAIVLVSDDDLRAMIEEDKGAEMTCHFCGEVYHFSEEELRAAKAQTQADQAPDRSAFPGPH